MPEELPPVPPTPIDFERTWKNTSKTTYSMRKDGSMKASTAVQESSTLTAAPGKEFHASNGEDFLKAKLRPTGVQLDLARDASEEQPHYK